MFISPASQYNSNYYFKEGELIYSELLNDVEYRGSEVEGGKSQKVRTCLNIYKVYDREGTEDWRLQRLEQDVKIHVILKHSNGWYEERALASSSAPIGQALNSLGVQSVTTLMGPVKLRPSTMPVSPSGIQTA